MSSVIQNTVFGFCRWDIWALIILIAVAAVFAVRHHKLKKEEKNLEDQAAGVYADDALK